MPDKINALCYGYLPDSQTWPRCLMSFSRPALDVPPYPSLLANRKMPLISYPSVAALEHS